MPTDASNSLVELLCRAGLACALAYCAAVGRLLDAVTDRTDPSDEPCACCTDGRHRYCSCDYCGDTNCRVTSDGHQHVACDTCLRPALRVQVDSGALPPGGWWPDWRAWSAWLRDGESVEIVEGD